MKDWKPEELKELRAKYGLSQVKFSKLVGVTPNYIFLMERGDRIPAKPLRLLFDCLEERITKPKKKRGSHDQGDL
jgi:DNA-binding transcriptional regulator YiaG